MCIFQYTTPIIFHIRHPQQRLKNVPATSSFVCDPVINSFPLSDRLHIGENTKSDVIRTRRGAIHACAHKTGLSGRHFAEEGTITIANEEAQCAE